MDGINVQRGHIRWPFRFTRTIKPSSRTIWIALPLLPREMLARLFLLASLPIALVSAWSDIGSTFAGSTSTAVYPPPGSTGEADEAYFPDASQVGYAGPTPSMPTATVNHYFSSTHDSDPRSW
jgi:hypothetical protein